jgi:hypothetical protein
MSVPLKRVSRFPLKNRVEKKRIELELSCPDARPSGNSMANLAKSNRERGFQGGVIARDLGSNTENALAPERMREIGSRGTLRALVSVTYEAANRLRPVGGQPCTRFLFTASLSVCGGGKFGATER